jgi:exopolyphosphatase/guanosine-5'-triphosphate,3'-diphosphate pyrophosphatase
VDDVVRRLRIPYADAEGLVPSLTVYRLMLEQTHATHLIVPDVSIRDGILLSLARGPDPELRRELATQVVASARALGEKYFYDEAHAAHVARLALLLFDGLQAEHGLDESSRLLLEVAAILHDIGTYVAATGHHKHGQYLVSNSEIFGIDTEGLAILSNVVRYHRRALPSTAHSSFASLNRERRIVVMKLAAILRVADALDRGHAQRVEGFEIERAGDELILRPLANGDISVERFGLASKGDMFEQVFGMEVSLL